MDSSLANRIRLASSLGSLLFLMACLSPGARAQDQLFVPAAPPMKFISSTERGQLSAARDAKSRLKTSIEMAENRLLRAEQFTVDQRYSAATCELGIYQAIIEDALHFLGQQKVDSDKTRDLYKRLEIQLRADSIRLESIRRVTPSDYAVHVKTIRDFTDNARTDALNCFFSDTVLPDPAKKQTSAEKEKTTAAAAPPTQPKKQQ
ncbi:MAG TPA: hypothetical protein VGC91_04410 [Pyrinomonadaceae bacterium]|jgi:hypothetical protein